MPTLRPTVMKYRKQYELLEPLMRRFRVGARGSAARLRKQLDQEHHLSLPKQINETWMGVQKTQEAIVVLDSEAYTDYAAVLLAPGAFPYSLGKKNNITKGFDAHDTGMVRDVTALDVRAKGIKKHTRCRRRDLIKLRSRLN
jgi:hypothetical protein